ncbi:MAG TPA: DUF2505 domain-containing protein [Actinomycetota bacterium]|nr:DUF2505 domain-containing protein [Actinomycetota bacterium]
MDFQISHSFEATADHVAEVLLDEGFQASLRDIGSLAAREVLHQEERPDGTVLRRIRCVLDVEISGAARRFLGDQPPSWIEEAVWDPTAMRWRWTILPEVGGDLLKAGGDIAIEQNGGGAARTVTGTVKVGVPLYGSKVEGWIVNGIEAAYDEEAERVVAWLGSHD